MTGQLYIVATPIGNLEDITARAILTLKQVDLIAAEDTRHSKRLLEVYDIATPLISLHEHNEKTRSEALINQLQLGKNIALISDAGTPLISDPGFFLIQQAQALAIKVIPIPGPSAVIAALSASGLPADQFIFGGFLPPKKAQRQKFLQQLALESRTCVFYETPHRIVETLADFVSVYGEARKVVMCRELTKKFETIRALPALAMLEWVKGDVFQQKGEYVLLVEGLTQVETSPDESELQKTLAILLSELSLNQAVKVAVKLTGLKKNPLYQLALALQKA